MPDQPQGTPEGGVPVNQNAVLGILQQISEAFNSFRAETNQRLNDIETARSAAQEREEFLDTPAPDNARTPVSTAPAAAASAPRKPILPKPKEFAGDRTQYPVWKTTMMTKLRIDGECMGLHAGNEVAYIASFLTDQAGMYIQPHQDQIALGQIQSREFWSFMDARYDDVHRQKRAGMEYDHLKQGNKPFTEFIAELERLSSEAGFDGYPHAVRISRLETKLCSELRQLSISGITDADMHTYEAYVQKLYSLDNRLKAAKMDGAFKYNITGTRQQTSLSPTRGPRQPPSNPPAPQNLTTQAPAVDSSAMDWTASINSTRVDKETRPRVKAVSRAELEARKAARACFTCGNMGHRARDCYYAPPRKGPRINAAITSPPPIATLASTVAPVQEEESSDDEEGKE
jgi:hypothetical protein